MPMRKEDSYTYGSLRFCGARDSHLTHSSGGTTYSLVHENTHNKSYF